MSKYNYLPKQLLILCKITLIPLVFLLAACNALQPIPDQASPSVEENQHAEKTSKYSGQSKSEPDIKQPDEPQARPDIELTEDILYQLLLAEIAGQRGKLDISVENYLSLARETRDPKVIERAARIAVYARDNKAASEAANLWIQVEPDNLDAKQILAVMAIRNGQIQQAVDHLEDIINDNQGQIDQKLWMIANMLGREKDNQTVLTVMERLMEAHQSDPNALFAYANVVTRMGDLKKAEQLLLQIIELDPDNQNAIVTYVSLLQQQDKKTEAIVWLKQKLQGNPENTLLQLVYARLLADAQRFDEAQVVFEKLDNEDPENVDVINALGYLHLQSNRLDQAKEYFIRLTKFPAKSDEAGYFLGRIAEEKQSYNEAIGWYGGVQKGQHFFDSQLRIGMILAEQGKIQQSREHFQSIPINSAEEQTIVIQAEAEMLIEHKRHHEALQVYNKALDQKYDADILYSRAMLAEKIDRLDILEADLKQILEKDPENSQALNALGYTLADRTDRHQEAYEYIKKAYEISPEDYYILDSMGWVLYRLGRLDEAIEYLQKAMELRSDPEIAAHLGEVLWVKGDKEGAKDIWDTAIQQTPEDTRLLDVIKRFTH